MKSFFFLSVLLSSVFSNAFTLYGTSSSLRGWANGEVTFYVNTANCPAQVDVIGLIKKALEVWNSVPTSNLKVKYGGTTTATTSSNPPIAYCETNFQGVTGASNDSTPGVAAANTAGGQINSGYLILNASSGQSNIANVSEVGLLVVITHEIGHVLGLGHSQTEDAIMYYTYSYKEKLNLAQDDIDGITYLYPANELDENKFAGCGTIKGGAGLPPTKPGNFLLLLVFLLLPVIVYFKLKSKSKVIRI